MVDCQETYKYFSEIYDSVQKKEKYDLWKSFTLQIWEKNNFKPNNLLDVACGTGTNSIIFAKAGFDVYGIDISNEMLAKEKIKKGLPKGPKA